jgi:hypothetical protein
LKKNKIKHSTRRLVRQTTCCLQAQILATTVVAEKSGQCFFFWQKTPNFEAISTQKHLLTPLEYTQTNLSTQNTKKKMSKNLKPNQVSFGFLILYMFYRQH